MFGLWIKALSNPTEENYTLILKENEPSGGLTALWVLIASAVSGVLQGLAIWLNGVPNVPTQDLPFDMADFVWVFVLATPILTFFSFYIGGVFAYLGAKMFKGQGDLGEQIFLQVIGTAPLVIFTAVASLIPFVGAAITALISLFSIYVNTLAIKVVHRLDWLQALGALFLPGILLGVFLCCCIFGLMALVGPSLGSLAP